MLVGREDFNAGENLYLHWGGPRRGVKALLTYVLKIEDRCNGQCKYVHGSRLEFYRDLILSTEAIMWHVLHSEAGMEVLCFMELITLRARITIPFCCKRLSHEEDTIELLQPVFHHMPQLVSRLLRRKNMQPVLVDKPRNILFL